MVLPSLPKANEVKNPFENKASQYKGDDDELELEIRNRNLISYFKSKLKRWKGTSST